MNLFFSGNKPNELHLHNPLTNFHSLDDTESRMAPMNR